MRSALVSLGVGISESDGLVTVTPGSLKGPASVDCGLAGTVMRFVPPVAALADGVVAFDGDEYARERPMDVILGALRTLGVQIDDGGTGRMPYTVSGTGSVRGGKVTLDASGSSQFVSALLLAGARYDEGVDIRHDGKPVPSQPHLDMSVAMLRERGVHGRRQRAEPLGRCPRPHSRAGHRDRAGPVERGAVPGRGRHHRRLGDRDRLAGGDHAARRPAAGDLHPLRRRGVADRRRSDRARDRHGSQGVDLDLSEVGELSPVIAAVAAFADGPSYLRGIAHLRNHETDRLAALETEFNALGGDVNQTRRRTGDPAEALARWAFRHVPRSPDGARRRRHRARASTGWQIENIGTTAKTMPEFPGSLVGAGELMSRYDEEAKYDRPQAPDPAADEGPPDVRRRRDRVRDHPRPWPLHLLGRRRRTGW